MAEIITMPRLSDTMSEGVVAKWLVKVGDTIEEGDILAEIETDKATMEFESFYQGVLLHVGIQEGEAANVDSLLAIVGEKGEDISELLKTTKSPSKADLDAKDVNQDKEILATENNTKTSEVKIPEGVEIITMPRLSDTMSEGTVAKWLKKAGDKVEEGDILAEIETDKATMEFESFHQGTLLHIGVEEGKSANVDAVLAIIGEKGTDVSKVIESIKDLNTENIETKNTEQTKPVQSETKKEENIIVSTPKSSSKNVRIIASPLAKKLALEKNIGLQHIKGTGEGGRIIKRDIENYAGSNVSASSNMPFVPTGEESFEEVNNSQMRKTIARRLGESKFTAPHYYLNVEFDMDNAIAFRNQYNSIPDTKISFNDMVVKATALALKQHPQVNSQWFDDKIRKNHHVHIGVAVGVDDGLLVPVLRFANEQNLTQIGAQVKDFAKRARDKKLALEEMEGSTFTISNLGMFGITDFTSIINQPNSAILSVGTIVQKPVVKNGNIVVGNTMKLTLACDHRTIDGVTGSLFLDTLKGYIENPITMLV